VREAEFFLAQAESLSESLHAPLGVGRSLLKQAELKMARGLLDEALETLVKAEEIVADVSVCAELHVDKALILYSISLSARTHPT
jgi:hypothetical protein